jgi:simple sugar transport system ATP-binding protein
MAQLPLALSSESAPPAGGAAPVPLCELQEVSVSYGTRLANDGVSLRLQPGEVVALLGENGAGKSTLLHALYGLVGVSGGQVRYRGAAVVPSPERAIAAGIGLIHQHFLLVPRLTVAENVVLGSEPRRLGVLLDRRRAVAQTAALAARYGLPVDPERPVTDLSVGESQRVELLKILYRGARCLLLDEPTAVLTPGEAQRLLAVLRELLVDRPSAPGITQPPAGAARLHAGATAEATRSPAGAAAGEGGSALLIVTHKLDEVLQVADRAVVMRRGRVVAQLRRSEFSAGELARAMVGRELHPLIRQPAAAAAPGLTAAAPALELTDVRVVCEGVERVRGVSLRLAAGTILGIAGVEGNGQSELGAAIAGLLPLSHGQVRLGGQDVTAASVRARKRAGQPAAQADQQRGDHRRGAATTDERGDRAGKRNHEIAGRSIPKPSTRRARRPELVDALPAAADDPERDVVNNQALALALRAMDGLSSKLREVFVLMELESMSAPEVAQLLELSVNTVYSRLRLARGRFDTALAEIRAREGAGGT